MSTNRIQMRLNTINKMEQNIREMPDSLDIQQEKKDFLKKLETLKADVRNNSKAEEIAQDLNDLNVEFGKLTKKVVTSGAEKIKASLDKQQESLESLQKKADRLIEFSNSFKKVEIQRDEQEEEAQIESVSNMRRSF